MKHIEPQPGAIFSGHFADCKKETYFQSKLLRIEEVSTLTTLGRSTINLWVAQSKFPKPTLLSPTLKVWRLSEISAWINELTNVNSNGGANHA
jgi:predicted DNA-binding transcriptional regulator AlpA